MSSIARMLPVRSGKAAVPHRFASTTRHAAKRGAAAVPGRSTRAAASVSDEQSYASPLSAAIRLAAWRASVVPSLARPSLNVP